MSSIIPTEPGDEEPPKDFPDKNANAGEVVGDAGEDPKNTSSSEEDELNIGLTKSLDRNGPSMLQEEPLEGGNKDVVSSDTLEESEEAESQSEGVTSEKAVEGGIANGQETSQEVEVMSRAPRKRQRAVETTVAKARKKRTQVMERIPRSKRCGTCPTCLNPHWKKSMSYCTKRMGQEGHSCASEEAC